MSATTYEYQEKAMGNDLWHTQAWFTDETKALQHWDQVTKAGVEARLLKVIRREKVVHYQSRNLSTWW